MLAEPYQSNSGGVAPLKFKSAPAIARRIEWLGQMEDRRRMYLAANDRAGLLVLASEYAARNMPRTANKIMLLADSVRKTPIGAATVGTKEPK